MVSYLLPCTDRSSIDSPTEHEYDMLGRRLGQLNGLIMGMHGLRHEVQVLKKH